MVVLVVGGAGYIGSHVARALKRHNHDVVIYDNLSSGHAILASGFKLVLGDLADATHLAAAMRRVDAIMHFAAHAYVGNRSRTRENISAIMGGWAGSAKRRYGRERPEVRLFLHLCCLRRA